MKGINRERYIRWTNSFRLDNVYFRFTIRSSADEFTEYSITYVWNNFLKILSIQRIFDDQCVFLFLLQSFDPNAPNIFSGNFTISDSTSADTFLLPMFDSQRYWEKGVAYVNQYNLGRYWPVIGPQVTLYVPSTWLNGGTTNTMTMIELQSSPCGNEESCSIDLIDYPILDKPTLHKAPKLFKRSEKLVYS